MTTPITNVEIPENELKGLILVIDEDPLLGELVHYHFTPKGYEVKQCMSLEEWYNTDASIFSLAIIDISIDGDSGNQIIEMLRQNPMTDDIPIIICTKVDNPNAIVQGLNAGADDFITRPFVVGELVARINAMMRRYH